VVRKVLEASRTSHDNDIITLPLKTPYRWQEIASYNATACTNAKLENNAQIKTQNLTLA